jgi:hypothetical protein
MEKLGNMVFGAAVAGTLLGPAAWADDNLQFSARLSQAATMVVMTTGEVSLREQAVLAARALLPHLASGARSRN